MSAPASGEDLPSSAEAEPAAALDPAPRPQKSRAGFMRLGILFAVLVALYVVGRVTGVTETIDVERVRETIREAGAWGALAYLGIFALGELVHVPGIVFVASALLVWGELVGLGLAFVGSMISVSLSFFVVRAVGGQALSMIERPIVKRVLGWLDERPLSAVIVLRLFLFLAPQLNYALALTRLRFRDYFLGSAIGLLPPLVVISLVLDWVLSLL